LQKHFDRLLAGSAFKGQDAGWFGHRTLSEFQKNKINTNNKTKQNKNRAISMNAQRSHPYRQPANTALTA